MRRKRPYDELGPSQQWERRRQGRTALAEIGVPANALCDHRPSPSSVLPLSRAERGRIRAVGSLSIPGERAIADCKRLLASQRGTETAVCTVTVGENTRVVTYVTDPLRLLRCVAADSAFVAVGGDQGGGFTKLGLTFCRPAPTKRRPKAFKQSFVPLLVYEGKDDYAHLTALRAPCPTAFAGDSADHKDIFSVLQNLIDTNGAFLNGDYPFISTIIGHKGPCALHPCPICIVEGSKPEWLLIENSRRILGEDAHSLYRDREPFLKINSERIVPTPLHLFLGISKRIIFDAVKELVGEALVLEKIKLVKSKHSAGCGGLSDLYSLNGPELLRFIKQDLCRELQRSLVAHDREQRSNKSRIAILSDWLQKLPTFLKSNDEWEPVELFKFRHFLNDMYSRWTKISGQKAFPQLHMLRHAVEFAERHNILGAVSESEIESFHFAFNRLYHFQHRNMSHQPEEHLRRCMADSVLAVAAKEKTEILPEPADALLALATASMSLHALAG